MPPHRGAITRPNDYMYGKLNSACFILNCISIFLNVLDPLFIVSGPKDHMKAAVIAKISMAKFVLVPCCFFLFYQNLLCCRKYVQYFLACSQTCLIAPGSNSY